MELGLPARRADPQQGRARELLPYKEDQRPLNSWLEPSRAALTPAGPGKSPHASTSVASKCSCLQGLDDADVPPSAAGLCPRNLGCG